MNDFFLIIFGLAVYASAYVSVCIYRDIKYRKARRALDALLEIQHEVYLLVEENQQRRNAAKMFCVCGGKLGSFQPPKQWNRKDLLMCPRCGTMYADYGDEVIPVHGHPEEINGQGGG